MWERTDRASLRLVLPLALLLYAVSNALPVLGLFQFYPDAVEHLDVARNLAQGEGLVSTFRFYFTGREGFPQPPQFIRPVLFSLLGAAAYEIAPDPRSLQVLNLLVSGLCLVLLYVLLLRHFGRGVAALALLLLAISRRFGYDSTTALSEPIALLAMLAALVVADHGRPVRGRFFVLGLWVGVGYLARPVTLPLLALVVLYGVLEAPPRRRGFRDLLGRAAPVAAGAVVAAAPLWLLNARWGLPLQYTPSSFTYNVLDFHSYFRWEDHESASARALLLEHPGTIVRRVLVNAIRLGRWLFLDRMWLGFLLLLWPAFAAWFRAEPSSHLRRFAALLLALGLLNLMLYASTWSLTVSPRYVFLSFVMFLPLLLTGLKHVSRSFARPARAFWLVGLLLLGTSAMAALQRTGETLTAMAEGRAMLSMRPGQDNPDLAWAADWLERRLGPHDAFAATDPWRLAFYLDRPSVLLPENLTEDTLPGFLRTYRIRAVIHPSDELPAWARAGRGFHPRETVQLGANTIQLLD